MRTRSLSPHLRAFKLIPKPLKINSTTSYCPSMQTIWNGVEFWYKIDCSTFEGNDSRHKCTIIRYSRVTFQFILCSKKYWFNQLWRFAKPRSDKVPIRFPNHVYITKKFFADHLKLLYKSCFKPEGISCSCSLIRWKGKRINGWFWVMNHLEDPSKDIELSAWKPKTERILRVSD